MSKAEDIMDALKTLLATGVSPVEVLRNSAIPEKIPADGLVILRDGDPGDPEQSLGGFDNCYYEHAVEIEVYVAHDDRAERDTLYDGLLQLIGIALKSDTTLGGLVYGSVYGRPSPQIEPVEGGKDIKACVLPVTLHYETDSPLA